MSIFKQVKRGMLMVLAVLPMLATPVHASPRQAVSLSGHLSLARLDAASAARIVQRRTGGKVLAVDQTDRGGRILYRVKVLLPEGRVRTVTVDAETGQMGG